MGNCVHYMYGLLGFAEILNIQNCVNSTRNCVLDVRIFWICRKIEHPELRKLNRKLCILCVRIVWIYKKIKYLELRKFYGNCVHYMYGLSGFVEILNIQNCVNSMGNVYIRCTDCLDLQKD